MQYIIIGLLVLIVILVIFSLIANIGILIAVARLGFKSGNLTNRGIVTGFPYNIVRHPDYSMQILFIITTTIPLCIMPTLSIMQKILMLFATFAWIYLYYLRAITEERHLIKDDEYKEYVQKVKYRFIPKLF
jgi:protein-S-isoprenylcysteine O-methyltransferase Ste14